MTALNEGEAVNLAERNLQNLAEYSVAAAAGAHGDRRIVARRVDGFPGLWFASFTTEAGRVFDTGTSYVVADTDRVVYPVPAYTEPALSCLAVSELLAQGASAQDFDETDLD